MYHFYFTDEKTEDQRRDLAFPSPKSHSECCVTLLTSCVLGKKRGTGRMPSGSTLQPKPPIGVCLTYVGCHMSSKWKRNPEKFENPGFHLSHTPAFPFSSLLLLPLAKTKHTLLMGRCRNYGPPRPEHTNLQSR